MDFVWLGRVWIIWAGCRHGTEDQLAVLFTCTNSTGRGSGPVHSAISIFLFWSNYNGAECSSGGLDTENKGFEMWGMLKFADKWASLAAVWSYDMANYQRIQQTVCSRLDGFHQRHGKHMSGKQWGNTNTKIWRNTGSFCRHFAANFTHKSGACVKKKPNKTVAVLPKERKENQFNL